MSTSGFILSLVFSGFLYGQSFSQPDYSDYERVLSDHVTINGKVDYESIIENDLDAFNRFLNQVTKVDPGKLTQKDQLAFWINAYNAFTIKLIIDHWPVNSIMDIHDGKPWDQKWITIDHEIYSLNNIEHDIIRRQFGDPRIHFAVNCAAKSCPPLLNAPYLGTSLDDQLELQTRKFVNQTNANQLASREIKISKIFEWYEEDFSDLIGFLNKYSETDIDPKATIRYNTYDWTLNN